MSQSFNNEYQALANNGIESNILFYGQEKCQPGYSYKGNNVRPHYVMHYILAGQGTFSLAGHHSVTLKAGDFFVLPRGIPCFYQADQTNPWQYFWIGLDGIKITNIINSSALKTNFYLKNIESSQFCQSLQQVFTSLHQKQSLTNNLLVESLTYQMFYHLLTEYPGNQMQSQSQPYQQYQLALTYLKDNYAYGCNITDLSLALSLSRNYLYNLFKKYSNMSPQNFLTQLRMEDAKNQLLATDLSIQIIADQVGYNDSFTFSKAFKRYSGYSPQVFRQSFQSK